MTLPEAKEAVSNALLGNKGVHAVSRRTKESAVILFFEAGTKPQDMQSALEAARELAKPFLVRSEIEAPAELKAS